MRHGKLILGFYILITMLLAAPTPVRTAEEKTWYVKAVHPEGRLLAVKAIDQSAHTLGREIGR